MTTSLSSRLSRLLIEHSTRYPHVQVQDIYKLLYQAALGSGHAVPEAAPARIWLEEEIHSLTPDINQPLVEQISPEARLEDRVVRVYLRPYLAVTNNIDPLLEAFVRTANEFVGSTRRLERYASSFSEISTQPDLHFSTNELENFIKEMREQGFPSIHHSEIYSHHYQPAYRVVAHKFLKPILALVMQHKGM